MHAQSGQMIIDRETDGVGQRERGWEVLSAWTEGSGGQETRGVIDTHTHRHTRTRTHTLTLHCTFVLSHSGFVM